MRRLKCARGAPTWDHVDELPIGSPHRVVTMFKNLFLGCVISTGDTSRQNNIIFTMKILHKEIITHKANHTC